MATVAEFVDVTIDNGKLQIGSEGYPLKNIARALVRRLEPRKRIIRSYLKTVAYILLGSIVIMFSMEWIGVPGSIPFIVLYLIVLTWLVGSSFRFFISLRRERRKLSYYTLVVETAGMARTLLAATRDTQIQEVANAIMTARDSQETSYHQKIENCLSEARRQYSKMDKRRSIRRSELTGPIVVVITRGSAIRIGAQTKKFGRAQEWLESNARKTGDSREDGESYWVPLSCPAFKGMKRDPDIDEYLGRCYLRRIDADDPWYWPTPNRPATKDRTHALRGLGHEGSQFQWI